MHLGEARTITMVVVCHTGSCIDENCAGVVGADAAKAAHAACAEAGTTVTGRCCDVRLSQRAW